MATDDSQPPDAAQPEGDSTPPEPLRLRLPGSDHPQRIGGFELLQKIGEGGMGTVWKARQVSLDRVVALKVLNADYSKSEEFITRFRNEARSAANLSHRHIIQVYDAGNADGADYLAMEFVEGKTVRAMLDAQGPTTETVALDIVIPVAQALHYAWERAKLIHRDVKPENILIDQDGTVKLGDLGLAKSAGTPENLKITRAGQTLGTPHYIAPEQAEGKRDLDLRSDIYSLGATLYHMVTGHALFEEAPTAQVMLKHIDEMVPDAREFQPQLSEGLCMVMEKMMAKDRAERYQGWQELISDLQLARAGRRPVNARIAPGRSTMNRAEATGPGGLPEPLSEAGPLISIRPQRRRMTPAMWVGVAIIIVCVAGVAALWYMSQKRERELRAELASRQLEAHAAAAARAYYEAMEFSRSHPNETEEILKRFEAVVRDYPNTEFAPPANEQANQWRQRLAAMQQEAAQKTAAEGAAAKEEAEKKAAQEKKAAEVKQAEAERAAAIAKAREERRQAAEEAQRARGAAQSVYQEFIRLWCKLLATRDYAGALQATQQAAANPQLAPIKELMATHMAATQRVTAFVDRLQSKDSPLIGKTVTLSNISGTISSTTDKGGVVIEKVAGVGVVVPLLTAPGDDFLRLAAATVPPGDAEGQLNYSLLLLAEYRLELTRVALDAVAGPAAAPFKEMYDAVIVALNEIEAPAYVAALRTQLASSQWVPALSCMLEIDTRLAATTAVVAAANELNTARDQLLSLAPDPATIEPATRLAIVAIRRAIEASDWQRALAIIKLLDSRLTAGAIPPALAATIQPELEELRQRVMDQSGLAVADALRKREVQKAGGRVWLVTTDGSGDAKSLTEALAQVKDGDGIELGPGKHEASMLDGSGKKNLLIYGSGGSLPLVTDAATAATAKPGAFLIRCGDGWRLENLHFQFAVRALVQAGANLTMNGCAFSRPREARLPGLILAADCDGGWRTRLDNCLLAAPASDAVFSQPLLDGVTRHVVQFNQCTLWLPDGSVHATGQSSYKRQNVLGIENCVVLAQRIASPTWPRTLMAAGFAYSGNNNLFFLGRHADDTPMLGDENWKSLYPDQDTVSVVRELTAAMLAGLRRGQAVPALAGFAEPSASDFRLGAKSPGVTLAKDKGPAGVRWAEWRWAAFLKSAPAATPAAEPAAATSAPASAQPSSPSAPAKTAQSAAADAPLASLFRGNVRQLSEDRVEFTYDFAARRQLADWHAVTPAGDAASAPGTAGSSFTILSGALSKTEPDEALLVHDAQFAGGVQLQLQAVVQKGAHVAIVLIYPRERLIAAVDLAAGLQVFSSSGGPQKPVASLAAKLSANTPLAIQLTAADKKLTCTVAGVGTVEAPLPADASTCEVGLAADNTLAQFSQLQLVGVLEPDWLRVALADAAQNRAKAVSAAQKKNK